MKQVVKTVVLFILGYCLYVAIEVTYRGYSFPIMGCCGGLAILLLDQINNRISWDIDILVQGLIGSVLVSFMELVIGELALHTDLVPVMWDYSNIIWNFDGVVCLPFSLVWMGLSIVAVIVADAYNYYVFGDMPTPYYKCFGRVICTFPERS